MAVKRTTGVADTVPDASESKGNASPTVVVYCNLPQGLRFTLPDGHAITFAGCPVSRLVGPDGNALPGGKYGKTRDVPRADWEWIYAAYQDAPYLSAHNPLLFAANSESEGDAIARDLSSTRHGREQIDPQKLKTAPYKADD